LPIVDTFSKRQKRERGDTIEVFFYNTIDPKLRVQIVTIWKEALGRSDAGGTHGTPNPAYRILHEMLATEFGMFSFRKRQESDQTALIDFFINGADTEQALDMIDLSFRVIFREHWNKAWASLYRVSISSSEAIADLNQRFLEHGVWYAFVEGDERV
jgi:AbiJ-like protein